MSPEPPPLVRVFLCHSSADKAAVRDLYRRLAEDGFSPWLDEEDLLPGEHWPTAIRSAVRDSEFVVVCLSQTSTTQSGYVHKEIKLALDVADQQPPRSIFVIPARLEDCVVPDRLEDLQWVDLFSHGGYDRLVRALRRHHLPEIPIPPQSSEPVVTVTVPGPALGASTSAPEVGGKAGLLARVFGFLLNSFAVSGVTPSRRRIVGVGVMLIAGAVVAAVVMANGDGHSTTVGGPPRATVKVGALYALSGADAVADKEALEGAQFAVDYINGHGGDDPGSQLPLAAGEGLPHLGGAKLDLVLPRAVPDRCTTGDVFDQFVDDDHVAAVVGAYASTITLRAIIAADRRRVPLVNGGSSVSSFTDLAGGSGQRLRTCPKTKTTEPDPRPSPWFFRVSPSDTQSAEQFFALIKELELRDEFHVHRIAIVRENKDIFGNGASTDTKKIARRLGIKFPRHDSVYPSVLGTPSNRCTLENDVAAAVKQALSFKPDVVFAASYPPDAIAVARAMQKYGGAHTALFAYGSGYLGTTFIKGAENPMSVCGLPRTNPLGIISHAPWSVDIKNPSNTAQRIAQLFKEHDFKDDGTGQKFTDDGGGQEMTSRAAVGFTAMMTLAQAIDKAGLAGLTDRNKIREELQRLNVGPDETIMPWAGIKFDEDKRQHTRGQNTRAEVVLLQILMEKYHVVYPHDRAKATDRAILPRGR